MNILRGAAIFSRDIVCFGCWRIYSSGRSILYKLSIGRKGLPLVKWSTRTAIQLSSAIILIWVTGSTNAYSVYISPWRLFPLFFHLQVIDIRQIPETPYCMYYVLYWSWDLYSLRCRNTATVVMFIEVASLDLPGANNMKRVVIFNADHYQCDCTARRHETGIQVWMDQVILLIGPVSIII